MMKSLLLSLCFLSFLTFANGQAGTSVNYVDNLGGLTLNYAGLLNGKHSYTETVTNDDVIVYYSSANSRWEISCNGCGVVFFSDAVTALNPPSLAVGNWQDGPGVGGSVLIGLSGTGTTEDVLPVELIRFEGTMFSDFAELQWSTASEAENKGFEIQRSRNGRIFETVGFIDGQGYSYSNVDYIFSDNSIRKGVDYYYRLNQINYSGSSELTDLINLQAIEGAAIRLDVSPNPVAGDFIQVEYFNPNNSSAQLTVFNVQGKLMISQVLEADTKNNTQLNIAQLPAGSYYIKVEEAGTVEYRQFIKS